MPHFTIMENTDAALHPAPKECKTTKGGQEYKGRQYISAQGFLCQLWNDSTVFLYPDIFKSSQLNYNRWHTNEEFKILIIQYNLFP